MRVCSSRERSRVLLALATTTTTTEHNNNYIRAPRRRATTSRRRATTSDGGAGASSERAKTTTTSSSSHVMMTCHHLLETSRFISPFFPPPTTQCRSPQKCQTRELGAAAHRIRTCCHPCAARRGHRESWEVQIGCVRQVLTPRFSGWTGPLGAPLRTV